MTTLIAAVPTGVVLLALIAGCAAHLTRPAALPAALTAHGVLPARAVPLAARAATLAEGLLGAAGTAALLARHRTALAAVLAAAAALFACYALYARHTLATGRGGPCGCSRAEVPLSGWIVGRAWAFALLALGAAPLVAGRGAPPDGAAEAAVVALATPTFAALLWALPTAMTRPTAMARPTVAARPAASVGGGHRPWTS
ncbi:MauE/DoxX family redox-associated membrane protein [Streptomyces radicis]|uniref:Methylamine utilization protein MauE n=1 Tax=Streptomyces radicis TaxID=1750517 RepID=A0A3A9VU25_9ACTN|nr:MauE/DoxX family redox-associated membrane protein [Streptomyces radicis]RKN04505.1 methylamine utilization protein MauE [Streptomyces radicis]RKN15483.1 methylamine utilization protein MauE [Streptomyces radicis]